MGKCGEHDDQLERLMAHGSKATQLYQSSWAINEWEGVWSWAGCTWDSRHYVGPSRYVMSSSTKHQWRRVPTWCHRWRTCHPSAASPISSTTRPMFLENITISECRRLLFLINKRICRFRLILAFMQSAMLNCSDKFNDPRRQRSKVHNRSDQTNRNKQHHENILEIGNTLTENKTATPPLPKIPALFGQLPCNTFIF